VLVDIDKFYGFFRKIRTILALLVALSLLLTLVYIKSSKDWAKTELLVGEDAFMQGAIGTEIMPLPVFDVLPDMFPEHFQPAGSEAGDWIDQFGFIRNSQTGELPVGFTISNRRPKSGSPSPVPFVATTCALCHSTEIQPVNSDESHFVIGPGNRALNLFAWLDALQASLIDSEKLNLNNLEKYYEDKHGRKLSVREKVIITLWLRQSRSKLTAGMPRFDEPFGHGQSRDPSIVQTGPMRTFPFRTIVRTALNRPGEKMAVYTKISTIYNQDDREWAQVDGSINDIELRSATAAFAAGATVQNLRDPDVAKTIQEASYYTSKLQGPSYRRLFPESWSDINLQLVKEGRELYMAHCSSCHGYRSDDGRSWVKGIRHGELIALKEIGTDPERITFRHYERIADKLIELFEEPHPFAIKHENLRAPKEVGERGYVAGPIDSAYLRAPYLHNASVMTMAELLNLEPRKPVFYRGRNLYDPEKLGYVTPDQPSDRNYFKFDTSLKGNSNRGHDYPWSYNDPDRDSEALKAILEYLKTI